MEDDIVPVFTEGGTVAHYIDFLQTPNSSVTSALCGRTPWPGLWFGTGSQDEEERASVLRVCSQCEAVVTHRRNGYVDR